MAEHLVVRIGPVDATIAREWLKNSREIVAGVRRYVYDVSVQCEPALLELVDTLLEMWEGAARGTTTFEWSMDVSQLPFRSVVDQWLKLGELTPDDLALIGCDWAPPWTRPMVDAVLAGVADAVRAFDDDDLRRRLEG